MTNENKKFEPRFPFEEGGIYYDRIFPFTATKVTLPLKIDVFDSLHIIPFDVLSDGEQALYMSIGISKHFDRKFHLGLASQPSKCDPQKWRQLHDLLDQFWKMGEVHEESVVEKWRDEILAFCEKENISIYEYIAIDPRNKAV